MAIQGLWNQTDLTAFVLLGINDLPELQIFFFGVFLLIYIVTIAGNLLVVVLIACDQHLHTPMYFFLGNLSCLETFYSTTILPRMIIAFLTGDRSIPIWGCFLQYYFFGSLVGSECYLLAAMSYDRFLAICKPLHYSVLMSNVLCVQLAMTSYISCFLLNSVTIYLMSQLSFCGPRILDHFFCDFTPVIMLACEDTHGIELMAFSLASLIALVPFLLTLISYSFIISTILQIPSTTGRQRAFSTCSSHLTVVTVFYGSLVIVYMIPKNDTLKDLNKVMSVFYTVLTPIVNPIVYCLRNREVKEALNKLTVLADNKMGERNRKVSRTDDQSLAKGHIHMKTEELTVKNRTSVKIDEKGWRTNGTPRSVGLHCLRSIDRWSFRKTIHFGIPMWPESELLGKKSPFNSIGPKSHQKCNRELRVGESSFE
ncbi:olfactory receptor 6B1-like [Paroedura picta]|uniref:olfactory receptor 6B1-like n=1 Tax=Paroedura picta TaxID=143630 RepID=UPI0040568934